MLPFGISVLPDIHVPDDDDDGVPEDLPVLPEEIYLMIARGIDWPQRRIVLLMDGTGYI